MCNDDIRCDVNTGIMYYAVQFQYHYLILWTHDLPEKEAKSVRVTETALCAGKRPQ